ncbi:hypothetical protein GL982_03755 [Spiroplasma citri]|uniref:hypothetical protein n=1 Tax=Spiroplasma citri TaxID=2133 RepID=UPI0013A09BB3|nr:hypothetical protein [Spiroplasma citri]QIA72811.1 hypothetical protein GL982_03755 [Spiroplasma citri]
MLMIFYTARMAGIKLEIKLLIDKYMYDNEKFILIDYKYQNNWQEYEIFRTYDRQDGFLELFLSLR